MILAHKNIRESGEPNFRCCKIPIPSRFNFAYLQDCVNKFQYDDKEILELLRFGCPISYTGSGSFHKEVKNHKGATDFEKEIDEYLEREKSEGAILGPYKNHHLELIS